MIYMPHTLKLRAITAPSRDSHGAIIPGSGTDVWNDVCRCRCDDNTTKEFTTSNGQVFRPSYHVVMDGKTTLKAGDEIKCVDDLGNIRGSGKVYLSKNTNYFNYSEIYV